MVWLWMGLFGATGCGGDGGPVDGSTTATSLPSGASADTAVPIPEFPAPDARPALRGPGGPARSFSADELFTGCRGQLEGGPGGWDHHNLVAPYRGHLVLPWASEWGDGGLSLFDVSDPCAPVKVADSYAQRMRETHAIGLLHLPEGDPHAGDYAVVNAWHGVLIWDLSDPDDIVQLSEVVIDGVFWPDAYARVAFSVFWQYPYLYLAAADNGIYVIDTTDPAAPELVSQYTFDPVLRAGGVFVNGTEMLVVSAEQTEAALLDVSDPFAPQLHPGGRFTVRSADGEAREVYAGNMVGPHALFARKSGGGGPIVYDITDPTAPAFVGDYHEADGNGGYIFAHEGILFVGNSHSGDVYDATDPTTIGKVGRGDLAGDLDTVVPFGNVAVLSVDDEAEDGVASVLVPWTTEPDARGPRVGRVVPADGATSVRTTARIGVGFDELIEPSSVHAGSRRVSDPDGRPVAGWGSAQETTAHWVPSEPLRPSTTYTVEVMAGGILDATGNPVEQTTTTTFTTGAL
jgi:hypothetical protein